MSIHKNSAKSRMIRQKQLRDWYNHTKRIYSIGIVFSLFQKNSDLDKNAEKTTQLEDETPDYFRRIRCPICLWKPQESDRWFCGNAGYPENYFHGCGTSWNTFITRGLCPGCKHQWRWTACLACGQWSIHEDWYVNEKNA